MNTGTPPGVGLGRTTTTNLQVGDKMTLAISGLGTQQQTVTVPR
jgi:2-keto-4-pentenoate hydratase/2-oxohepta-3-ene-1,7-dioic acid hydratase in catechol pathway